MGWMMVRMSCSRSGRWKGFSSIFTLPLSMRLMSSTSLIRLGRCSLEVLIFRRYSLTSSLLSRCVSAREVKPMMAFMGVRMSWDMLLRNWVFARLACSAAVSAVESTSFFLRSVCTTSSTFLKAMMKSLPSAGPSV